MRITPSFAAHVTLCVHCKSALLCGFNLLEKFMKLTEREIELIDGMIEVQLHHAQRCESMKTSMAEKQKGWDLERVSLLEKIKKEAVN